MSSNSDWRAQPSRNTCEGKLTKLVPLSEEGLPGPGTQSTESWSTHMLDKEFFKYQNK